jgi:hypothetical protein
MVDESADETDETMAVYWAYSTAGLMVAWWDYKTVAYLVEQ